MYYIVYKTINLVNNKFYIGKHNQHIDPYQFDGYYGSGSQIQNAVKKYGKENFIRETLFVFDNETDCLLKEEEIVAPHLGKSYCYNMRSGGIGGFEHINRDPEKRKRVSTLSSLANKGVCRHVPTEEEKEASRQRNNRMKELGIGPYSPEAKKRAKENIIINKEAISNKLRGSNNGSYGKKWCVKNDAVNLDNKQMFKEIPEGWITTAEWRDNQKNKSNSAYGRHWYNNGYKNFYLKPTDNISGLTKGRLRLNNCCGFN